MRIKVSDVFGAERVFVFSSTLDDRRARKGKRKEKEEKGTLPFYSATAREKRVASPFYLNVVSEKLNTPSENLINLFELPILFYASCIYLYVAQQVDVTSLALAYCFLIFRTFHSVVHCTYNKVMHRFYFYILSSIMLWVLIIRSFVAFVTP